MVDESRSGPLAYRILALAGLDFSGLDSAMRVGPGSQGGRGPVAGGPGSDVEIDCGTTDVMDFLGRGRLRPSG